MNTQLLKILAQESAIFGRFNACQRLGNGLVACARPNSNLIPHWNVVYPPADGSAYEYTELTRSKDFFKRHGVPGHVMLSGEKWRDDAVEAVQYFYRDPSTPLARCPAPPGFSMLSENDLNRSSPIINVAFEMDDATGSNFKEQLQKLSESLPSQFWLYGIDGNPCAALSSFTTPDGANFLFNASVLPQWRGQGVATAMFYDYLARISHTVYTYTDNPVVRDHLLPGFGFISAGEIFVVSLQVYLRKAFI